MGDPMICQDERLRLRRSDSINYGPYPATDAQFTADIHATCLWLIGCHSDQTRFAKKNWQIGVPFVEADDRHEECITLVSA